MFSKLLLNILVLFFSPQFLIAAQDNIDYKNNSHDNKEQPQLLLLKSFRNQENFDVKNWFMSEKLDGVRAYWNGTALYTRNGNRLAPPPWFIQNFPDFELDGELWTKRADFEHIMSIVNQHEPHNGWSEISYQIFEVPNAQGGLGERLEKIKRYLQRVPSSIIKMIPQQICASEQHLESFLVAVEKLGGEGVVIRNPDLPYHTGRSNTSLKVKSFQDAECKVTGYKKGKGKIQGLTGAIICQLDNQKEIAIGSGLTNQERENPPAIGTIITYKHYGFTTKGNPRFPVFLRIRKIPAQ